ncbi:MAG: hypothetical protein CL583_13015 [Alteromonadaceae bacterium]|nr:hypothetical protein [Alteromonadaceae bacterium]
MIQLQGISAIATAFASHYRRNPLQFLSLILITTLAVALWASVHILTDQARSSFAQSEAAVTPVVEIQRTDGAAVTEKDFGALRQAGVCVTPRLTIKVPVEPELTLIGIDPLSSGCAGAALGNSGAGINLSALGQPRLWGNLSALDRWRQSGLALDDTQLEPAPNLPSQTLLGDIGVVARHRSAGSVQLQLVTGTLAQTDLPPGYRALLVEHGVSSDELAESFLFNLDALALLAMLVAALLIRSVYVFGLSQRQPTLKVLERSGVPRIYIVLCLGIELAVIGIVGATAGLFSGSQLARLFSGGLRETLGGLFDVVARDFVLPGPELWVTSLVLILGVMLWACGDLVWRKNHSLGVTSSTFPQRARSLTGSRTVILLIMSLLVGAAFLGLADNLWQLYAGVTLVLCALAVILPHVIVILLRWLERRAVTPLAEWSFSEMQALTREMAVPLIALAFSIAAAIGVHSMVTSFGTTFSTWLEQRLQGDIYLTPSLTQGRSLTRQMDEWTSRLEALPGVERVSPRVYGRGLAEESPVDVIVLDAHSAGLGSGSIIASVRDPLRSLAEGDGVMVNEQLARRLKLAIGDRVALQVGRKHLRPQVLAVYADYGRPAGEAMLTISQLGPALNQLPQRSLGYSLAVNNVEESLIALEAAELPGEFSFRDQAEVRQLAEQAFARTFRLTGTLISLTLLLSSVGLLLIGLATFRIRRSLYTLLHVFGLTLSQVQGRLITHSAGLAFLLAVLAIPVGMLLAWLLVARVNPLAFGWALPFEVYPLFWLKLVLVATLIGAFVGWVTGGFIRRGQLPASLLLLLLSPMVVSITGCDLVNDTQPDDGFASLGSTSDGFSQPHPGLTIKLPADMGAHPDFRLEWWYLTANLKAEDGRRFGAQWTLFRQSLSPPDPSPLHDGSVTPWKSPAVWMAHAALSSPGKHAFAEKLARGGTAQAGAETDPVRLWLDDWQLREKAPGVFAVNAGDDEFQYWLEVTLREPPTDAMVLHGSNGFSAKSQEGQGSMYFSFVDMAVRGRIQFGAEMLEVTGTAWLDREWSSQLLGRSQKGWDWFSMHLDDNSELMVFQLRGSPDFQSGTLIQADGTAIPLSPAQIELLPHETRETETGEVPTEWLIQIPDHGLDLTVNSWPGEYWNQGLVPYWEGPIDVSGSHTGEGFLEMTGYSSAED